MIYFYWALSAWLALAVIGIPVLYIGYGFVMAAKRARDEGRSQRRVVIVDGSIAALFILLDALLNVFVFSVLMLDFRLKVMFKKKTIKGYLIWVPELITGRFCVYNNDPEERLSRRWTAHVLAAFLDGKDAAGYHIKGLSTHLDWLD